MRARNAGCFGGGFFVFRRAVDPSCRTLVPKLRDMQDNLARLDHLRRRGGGRNVADRVRELQGMMNARGCDVPGGDFDNRPAGNFLYEPDTPYYSGNGTYRTLCVRTCDGYYFPISFSTTSDHFPADARSCEALCPGAEARLFYYPNPGGGPENMISITGEQYSSLPTAFKYRTSIDSACTCRPAGGYLMIAAAMRLHSLSSMIRARRCRGRGPRRGKIRRPSPIAPDSTCQAPSTWRSQALRRWPSAPTDARSASWGQLTGATRNRTTW